ncbi:MAG TPA: hypothetical protein ENJ87_09660 [Gammaproteobacteria bacterium]|nr:hypothetical protein [Gammaproteobacteria bacterium]
MLSTPSTMPCHRSTTLVFCAMLLLLCQLLPTNAVAKSYAIVLASAPGKNLDWEAKKSRLLKGHTLYVEKTVVKGAPWERLCLGFFSSRKQAVSLQKKLQKIYPGAWIQKASKKNRTRVITAATVTKPTTKSKRKVKAKAKRKDKVTKQKPVPIKNTSSLSQKQLDSLMLRAKSDFKNKKYTSAIRYLTALTAAGSHKYSREALELQGLARHRKGQSAHAVNTYEHYLKLYPDGEGSERVRQRLAGLLTATRGPRKKIRMSSMDKRKSRFTTAGSLSQFYRVNRASTNNAGTVTNLSQLITFLDVTTVNRSAIFDQRFQITADHTYDFISVREDNRLRLIETYYELNHRRTGTSGKLGRQTLRIGGILKRFDGLSAGYQITPDMRINLLGGYPVEIDRTSINNDKTFYGLTFETGTFLEHWDMNLFYFEQRVGSLRDFSSTGTEIRYHDRTKSLFGMIDYDMFYKEIHIAQLNANIQLAHGRSVYLNTFIRKSPLLATSNALVGRQEKSISELKKVLNAEQIYQLARDRTADNQTITIGGSQPVTQRFQVAADLTFTRIGDTRASGGVAATPGTGTEYFLNTQLVGNSLLMKNDSNVLGLRYYDTRPTNTISLIANSRFPIVRNWRINPRLQLDFRNFKDGRSQTKLRMLFKTDYRFRNKARFNFEIGYDRTSDSSNAQALGNNNLFLTLGYRWNF